MLMRPKSGTRNQKIESCEPSNRSFLVKSIAASVVFPPHAQNQMAVGLAWALLEIVKEIAKNVSANMRMGKDDLKHRSSDSANVMKMPVTC